MIPVPEHIRGLIFDCDGTLADTMPLHFLAWSKAMAECGLSFPESAFYAMAGIPTVRIIEILAQEQNKAVSVADVADQKERHFEELLERVTPISQVIDVVHAYAAKLPMAVATGGIRRLCEKTLNALGLLPYFQAIVTADDVLHGKPAPDIFLEAAKRLGVTPERCLVFEDADLGLQAARAAVMAAVDIRRYLSSSLKSR